MISGAGVDHGAFLAVPALIERQVDLTGDRPAVTHGERTLSYRELDGLANGLAAHLAGAGVRRGDVVPVLLPDGLDFAVACLALMKLGAAFVPLDPEWPAATLDATLAVLAPRLVVDRTVSYESTLDRPGVPLGPEDLIYGIFTSGSTGTPRCALNTHRGLVNRFAFMTRYFAATGAEVVLQNSRHTVDSSVWQLFWPLTVGARSVIPVRTGYVDLEHTVATIHRHRVTLTDFVPSLLGALVGLADTDPGALARLGSLTELVVGGEEIVAPVVHRLCELLPGLRITNGYGPTEASIGMAFHPVTPADGDAVPLGRPIDNCYAVVLGPDDRPLPVGEVGEIVIGGACLGLGYLGDPVRTAEAFVPNPFPAIPGRHLYRTGDLGRLDTEGRLFFHGRRDFQVKIGGVRIELGEIAAAAERCPGVRQARVLLAPTRPPALAVFVAATGLDDSTLGAHLRSELPRDRRPRYRFVLPELPLTDGGKVDRARLRLLLDAQLSADEALLAAEVTGARPGVTAADRILGVFRRVLLRPDLGPDDDFFDAGGDSLAALRVIADLRATTPRADLDGYGAPLPGGAPSPVAPTPGEAPAPAAGAPTSGATRPVGVADLFAAPTATRLAGRLAPPVADEHELMELDSALPAGLDAAAPGPVDPPTDVLVTGATGFVGSRIVYELLAGTSARVHVLCRAADEEHAARRVAGVLQTQGLWRPGFADRLRGHAGDLAAPGLGLSGRGWDRLAVGCDAIVHSGAMVNFLFDYLTHRPANVLGTRELLRLALTGRPKALHHVSTLGVLEDEAAGRSEPLAESTDAASAARPGSGYSRSKWVAERCLTEARHKGAHVTIYRLGEVMAATDTGHPNGRAATELLLAAVARLGVAPDVALRTDWTPADHAARAVVAGLFDPRVWGRNLHVFHPDSVDLVERSGLAARRVPVPEFVELLRADPACRLLAGLLDRKPLHELVIDNPRLFRREHGARLDLQKEER
ncbi:amino acid adenylation domain-containing protein [Longispora sp. NPDC051575]|uniref:amino acid adenylation domain-containing protein n=1 Tax=Longispora sp. NPDC051575 TaxID=3154943 RepID=UPI0034466E27